MGMSDCAKCWETPCSCGWDYKDYSIEKFSKFLVDILSYHETEDKLLILELAIARIRIKSNEIR